MLRKEEGGRRKEEREMKRGRVSGFISIHLVRVGEASSRLGETCDPLD